MKFQTLLRIDTAGHQVWPDVFREAIAKAGDGILPPSFFHYEDDGRTVNGSPSVRFLGGKSWVGILAHGDRPPEWDTAVGLASRVAGEMTGQPVRITIEEHKVGFSKTDYPVRYRLRRMVMKRRSDRARSMSTAELIKERLIKSLESEAARLGLDLPHDDALGVVVHDVRERGLRMIASTGPTNEYMTLADAEVTMFLKLRGLWQAGSLQSRGYGRIIGVRGEA